MKLGLTLLSCAVLYTITQDFITGVNATTNNGSLILNSNEVLEINTTAPYINCSSRSCNYSHASHQNRSSSNYTYPVAVITFTGNITFKSGSIVKVFGEYALSMISLNANIEIQSDINMTCGKKVLDTTCLGGFTQPAAGKLLGSLEATLVHKGLGPGGLIIPNGTIGSVPNQCISGSSHGGKGHQGSVCKAGPPYDIENMTSLLGGSGGSCLERPGSVAGGGAIELVAEKGKIVISASIRASAQVPANRSSICSGGSGGLIRLKANTVEIEEMGKLIVDGGHAHQPGRVYALGGGGGGIIQIIAPQGSLANGTLSLRHGTRSGSCDTKATNGHFLLKGSSLTSKASDASPTGTPRHSSASPTTGTQSGHTLEELVNQLKTSIEEGNKVNMSDINEVLTRHQSLADRTILNSSIMDLCLGIFKGYQAITDYVAKEYPNVLKRHLKNILKTASLCLHKKNHAFWKETQNMPNLMQSLEDILTTVVNSSFPPEINYTIWTPKAVAEVVKKGVNSLIEDIRTPNYLDVEEPTWKGVSDFVFIPKETVMKAKGNYSYIVVLYKDVEDGLPNKPNNGNEDDDLIVSSFVMSCFLKLDEKPVYDLSPPALLTFKTLSAEKPERQCSYWNLNESEWLTDGVKELKPDSSTTHTVCQADHFTSFAILMQHRKIPFSKEDILALSIITYIGCGISTTALIITLIIFLSIESLSSERHKIHTNLVVALLLAHVLFLAGIKETSNEVLCEIIAVFLHYFFLTAFTWMLVEGLHLYLKVVQVFRSENIKMAYYYVFGWCFSIIPVVITLSMKRNSYGNSEVCWLSTEDGTVWAFIGPVIAIIAINCFVLGMVVKTVVSSASAVKSTDHEHVKAGIKGLFVLMPILGVGWVLGLFALNKGTIVFVYAFAIVNGFQGLLIFLLHCVFNTEVRQAFRRQREKHALSKENDSQYNASFSLSPSEASGSKRFSNSNSFEKLKAAIPLKRKSTSKVVQVQPVSDSRDFAESSVQVKRAFQNKSTSKLSVTNVQNETSFLNCPMESEESVPPLIAHSKKQETTKRNRQSRP